MKKELVSVFLTGALVLTMAAGCGTTADNAGQTGEAQTEEVQVEETQSEEAEAAEEKSEEVTEELTDQEAADRVADMIDAIYVQNWTESTDTQCREAKEAWDALTDAQKALVSGENADPDYFGRDTGDASKDNPRNTDDIGEKEILVVSFGTSFNDSRAADIQGVEDAIAAANPEWSVRRAFTAQIIINHILARDGESIDNVEQAMQRAVDNGVKELVIQPTHLMHGAEYDELCDIVEQYIDKIDSIKIAEPLLGEVGSDASVINDDKLAVAAIITKRAVSDAGYESLEAAKDDGTAFVFMGHGTGHEARISYDQMTTAMESLGYDNVFIGTVEGEPEDTACENVIAEVKDAGYAKVILRPLMVVAGDHANNDMAGDDSDSWKSQFTAAGFTVECQIKGLGEIENIQQIYVNHTAEAVFNASNSSESKDAGQLADGNYLVDFNTDSSMFRVNETYDGKGLLNVKDGQMTVHIVLVSEKIVNLYPGTAADAEKAADLLEPTEENVEYSDGTSENVYAFDVPVPAIGEEFDLAIIGTKGKWYDHKVSVNNPEPFDVIE